MSEPDVNAPETAAVKAEVKPKSSRTRLAVELTVLALAAVAACVVAEYRDLEWWCYLMANCGYAEAQYKLAEHLLEEDESEAAVVWFHRAAERGSIPAQLELYRRYRIGYGVGRNAETAMKWLNKAADTGDAEALFQLGSHYLLPGKLKSEAKAKQYLERAVAAGSDSAREVLESMEPGSAARTQKR